MSLRELRKSRWHSYLAEVSRALGANRAEIEVTGLGLGDRVAADWVSLVGFSYDRAADVISIATDQITHRMHHPQHMHLDYESGFLRSLEVIDAHGNHHIARLKDALEVRSP